MENQNKLDNQFKNAAGKVENKGFDRMEAIWDRVEEKLDHKKKRRGLIFWRYGGVAALLLILLAIGGQFFKKHTNPTEPELNPETQVTTIDHNKVEETFNPTTVRDTQKIEVVVGEGNNASYTIEADSIHFDPVTKKARVWNTRTDKGEFRVKGEITPKKDDSSSSATTYSNVAINETENENLNEFIVPSKDKYTHLNSFYFGKDSLQNKEAITATVTVNNNMVTGVVSDFSGALPGAYVTIKGTNKSVSTDIEGKFSIEAKKGDILEISYIGYNEESVAINNPNIPHNILLEESTNTLEEVVVVAYGTQKRKKEKRRKKRAEQEATIAFTKRTYRDGDKKTTGYLSAPKGELDKGFQNNQDYYRKNMYKEGATVVTSSDIQYDTLSNGRIQFREIPGQISETDEPTYIAILNTAYITNTAPLYVVDGVAVNEDTFRNLNQNDIATVKVLKDQDAITAYGDKGVNGVLVITTVKGTTIEMNTAALDNQSDSEKRALLQGVVTTRGNNTPLYILDGMPVDEETVKNMNVNDVANIRVLKDAGATSLYGMRGSNGVVVIKTKQGEYAREIIEEDEEENEPIDPSKIQVDRESYNMFEENQFENPTSNPLSTFSIDVDNASYTNIRRFLNNGQKVPKDAVRVEEMINFFKYNYPQPKGKEPFSINTEYSDAPWNPDHKLLKIGLKGKEIPMDKLPASNFVFLIDVSGSMSDDNKLPLLKQSMKLLVNQMRPEDKIAIVVYAGAAGLVLPSTNGSEKTKIIDALNELSAGGSTDGGEGIELAYKTAQENFIKGGNNRVILATDGDFNVGDSSDRDMQTLIEEKRQSGVFLTCLGYGMGNYKDSKMEILADKGNGNYAYIDNMQEADRFLQKEFKGSMYAIAKDVKIQIEFNPNHVQSYRLIGYENRKLRDEDFENDAIDAGELGSGHTVTALYEIIPVGVESDYFTPDTKLKYTQQAKEKNKYKDELATVKLRHKKPDGNKSTETELVIENKPVELDEASADFKFAASVAWFGLKLRDSELIPSKSSKKIKKLGKEGIKNDTDGYKAEFIRLVDMVQ
ncbi:von Willebrand factor type A domain-containing protein [Flavobacterium rakeshii]|uniref:YfbK domain-containing protein n=1 Tax=Flavobacterium rakeshii TaxID=1038845 RepID=UPI002E7C3913|nr:von Willebrand factor type A domain-containing protein [Flavobacterium rakeshii]MEE1898854.1 von Willebrand factor type A domain-containing protein [Flavobacterium rakeshii]